MENKIPYKALAPSSFLSPYYSQILPIRRKWNKSEHEACLNVVEESFCENARELLFSINMIRD